MRKQLIVQGESALDIFSVLISILKSQVIHEFGNHIILCECIGKELDVLAAPFREYGILLQHQVLDRSKRKEEGGEARRLPDYKIWVPLSTEKVLCLNFDYLPSVTRPSHLE